MSSIWEQTVRREERPPLAGERRVQAVVIGGGMAGVLTARELAGRGICCNAIAPGLIETDMTEALDKTALLSSIPLGRAGKPEDVAALALFLAGPGGDYITGEVIRVDGGMAI